MSKLPNISNSFSIGPIYRELLYKIVMLGVHKNILEIGCMNGYSTSAFTTALDNEADFKLTLCDIRFSSGVKNLASKHPDKITLKEQKSINTIDDSYDLIFVDGDHNVKVVAEEIKLLLKNETKTIIAHDTHIINGGNAWWGPPLLKSIFDIHPQYHGFSLYNPNVEFLRLGLSIYSRDFNAHQQMYQLALEHSNKYQSTYIVYLNQIEKSKQPFIPKKITPKTSLKLL
jgi:hypothetical protein